MNKMKRWAIKVGLAIGGLLFIIHIFNLDEVAERAVRIAGPVGQENTFPFPPLVEWAEVEEEK